METFIKHSLTFTAAEHIARAAMEKAGKLGIAVSVTIVDESGIVKFFARMDGAPLISVDASRKKAVTAAGFGLPTGETWFNFIKDDPIMREGVHGFHDFILMGGGLPVIKDNHVVGAIGISGGHYSQDHDCARQALDSLNGNV
jgi:uncharacterized protein GlcG (DUF336 family)